MSRVKPRIYTQAEKAKILQLHTDGMETRDIALLYDTTSRRLYDRILCWRRYERKPKLEAPKKVAAVHGTHLAGYHKARRGFHVPPSKSNEYKELLLKGVPIVEAGRQLGLVSVTDRT